ncbi:hypothetical protein F0562_035136 [Nyssa sinensis]|uniref:PRONE domain-containing protein n=1 Tax=Nyssa sinensis TaxID=561372 RepID=A0A5J5AAE7_9ASTE|nr:hypothetical protein F0562_035136 [Nyssa sinensis]
MSDALGLVQFLNAVGEMARGACEPSLLPVWQRELLNARSPPRITCIHHEYEDESNNNSSPVTLDHDNLVHQSFLFGPKETKAIKKHLPPHIRSSSTFDVITACVWRSSVTAFRIDSDEVVRVMLMVNVRGMPGLDLPSGYYGNAIASSAAISKAGTLCDNPLGYAMGLVKKAKARVSEEYTRSVADLMVIKGRPPYSTLWNFMVSDTSRAGFGEVDFGWGKAVYGGSVGSMFCNNSIFARFRNSKGVEGVVVPMCLPSAVMKRFLEELEKMTTEPVEDSIWDLTRIFGSVWGFTWYLETITARRALKKPSSTPDSASFVKRSNDRIMTYDGLESCIFNSRSYENESGTSRGDGCVTDSLDEDDSSCSSSYNAFGSFSSHWMMMNRDEEGMEDWEVSECPHHFYVKKKPAHTIQFSDVETMKERFAKLLLGEDITGGCKGISTALALSNAITNLAASIFGELWKLEPLPEEGKSKWRREMDWLLSPTKHMVELVPAKQNGSNGRTLEIMTPRTRADIHLNLPALQKLDSMLIETLDSMVNTEFWYAEGGSRAEGRSRSARQSKRWWLPLPQVPISGLSETRRKKLLYQGKVVYQVLKAAKSINENVLLEMPIPTVIKDALPKASNLSYLHSTSNFQ